MLSFAQHTKNWNEALDEQYYTVSDMCRAVDHNEDPELWILKDRLKADYYARKVSP